MAEEPQRRELYFRAHRLRAYGIGTDLLDPCRFHQMSLQQLEFTVDRCEQELTLMLHKERYKPTLTPREQLVGESRRDYLHYRFQCFELGNIRSPVQQLTREEYNETAMEVLEKEFNHCVMQSFCVGGFYSLLNSNTPTVTSEQHMRWRNDEMKTMHNFFSTIFHRQLPKEEDCQRETKAFQNAINNITQSNTKQ